MRCQLNSLAGTYLVLTLTLMGCALSRVTTTSQAGSTLTTADSTVTVFLLERDIPAQIERLGVVAIRPVYNSLFGIDSSVKTELSRKCQELGANGAYRLNDGTYYPNVVSYLVFRYKKQ